MDNERIQHYLRRLSSLEQERASWESHWRDLAAMFLPRRSRFLNQGGRANDGARNDANLVDSTGILAVRTLASGMQSGLTSPARPWFRLTLRDSEAAEGNEARVWLHAVEQELSSAFARSNFYDSVHMLYHELGVFGTGCLLVEEDADSVLRCRTLTVGEYCLDTNGSGRVDTLYRRILMTPRQILDAWPDTCPNRIKDMAAKDSAERLEILHLVEPNPDYKEDKTEDKNSRPFLSVHMLMTGQREVLEESGYYEFPALAPRWDITGDDVYGKSPAMGALGDAKMLQRMRKDGLESLAKEVNPPLLVPSTLTGQAINGTPGAINYISPLAQGQHNSITPLYQVRASLQNLEVTISAMQKQIRESLFNDLFLMINNVGRQMTAREVAERNAEKMLLLGPVLDRLRSELFQPLIFRAYGIASRQGLVPPPPDALQGQQIKLEVVSILAQAQKSAGITAVQQVVEFAGGMARMSPGILDKVDFDEALDQMADMLGAPPRLIRAADAVAEMRSQREQQAQSMQKMQMLQQTVGLAGNAAKAAKDAGLEGNIGDALKSAMSGQGEAPAEQSE